MKVPAAPCATHKRKNVLDLGSRWIWFNHLPQLGCFEARSCGDRGRRGRIRGRGSRGRSARRHDGKCRGNLNMQKREMATVENIKNAVTSAVAGAKYGIHRGNQVVGAAKAIDSFMGGQPARSGRVGAAIEGYAGGQRADALRQQFARTNPRDAPGPRTAAFYQYRFGAPGRHNFSGTPTQHGMLNMLRRQQEQIRAARTTPRVGRFRDQAPPTSQDFVSEEDLIRRFASSPSDAQRAIERRAPDENTEIRRVRPRRPAARSAMPPGAAHGELITPQGPPRILRPR